MSTFEAVGGQYEIIDHNIIPDSYVTYIVDIWEGDRNDPATGVGRYIGVWNGDDLETEEQGAFDPDFTMARSKRKWDPKPTPEPLHWALLEETKKPDRSAENHRDQEQNLTKKKEGYYQNKQNRAVDLYTAFLDAIDTLAEDDTNEQAWRAVEAWRSRLNDEHEK